MEGIVAWFTNGGMVALAGWMWKMAVQFGRIEFKCDTMWDFTMRRAMVEAINKGVIEMNSPISVPMATRSWYAHMEHELREWWHSRGRHLKERDQFIDCENRFGERIMREVCLPQKLNVGACIIAAIEIAKLEDEKAGDAGRMDSDSPTDTELEP